MGIDLVKLREDFKDPHYLVSTSDGKELFLRVWEPENSSKIAILILHGITAYSEPYKMLGVPLSKIGYTVYGLDLRGHGLSDGIRGDYPSDERLVKDLGESMLFLKEKHPTLILLGHSLGALTALIASNFYLKEISGLILISAAKEVKPGVYKKMSISTKLKILLSSIIKPSKPIISYYRDGMTGLNDPLYNFKYTLRFMKILNVKKLNIPDKFEIPIALGIGEHDEIFSVESARSFFDEIPSENKRFVVLPGAKHAEFPEGSWSELINWLSSTFKL
jgi:alpha-beta hydrolase superfamily lysophospholipase